MIDKQCILIGLIGSLGFCEFIFLSIFGAVERLVLICLRDQPCHHKAIPAGHYRGVGKESFFTAPSLTGFNVSLAFYEVSRLCFCVTFWRLACRVVLTVSLFSKMRHGGI